MEALRDPFSRVCPIFWPVLWLSLRAFAAWSGRMIEDGHAFAGLHVEITWYGWIHVVALDLSEMGAEFRRHMSGAPRADGRDVLRRACERVEALIAASRAANPFAAFEGGPRSGHVDPVDRCEPRTAMAEPGTGPPRVPAPLPQAGRGAAPASQATPHSRPARVLVLAVA